MKRYTKQYLLFNFILGYLFFGILVFQGIGFLEIFKSPPNLCLLILGSLSSFFSTILTFMLNKEDLGGLSGLVSEFRTIKSKKSIILIPLFFAGHYLFGLVFNNIIFYKDFVKYIIFIPIIGLIFASQEIGWRKFIQVEYEIDKGYTKSIIITGLFWSLWFFPLVFIRGFIVMPQFFAQFAMFLVGINFLLSSLYKNSGSILYSSILSGLIFGFAPLLIFKQNYALMAIALMESALGSSFKDKEFK